MLSCINFLMGQNIKKKKKNLKLTVYIINQFQTNIEMCGYPRVCPMKSLLDPSANINLVQIQDLIKVKANLI